MIRVVRLASSADMKALQELLIATEQKLLPAVSSDKEISDRLNDFSQR